jgi:hypothetical protein
VATIPQSFASAFVEGRYTLVVSTLFLLYFASICYLLIFKTTDIVKFLKLDKGFDQELVSFHPDSRVILSICIIVIGGIFVAEEFPNFCGQLITYIQYTPTTRWRKNPQLGKILASGFELAIGFLLVVEQRRVVDFIERRRKK